MEIIFLRHGHRGNGPNQDTLTEIGIEQAKRTSSFLRETKFDKIICGTSKRARDTLEFACEEKSNMEYNAIVNEQSLGVLEGKSGREFEKARLDSGLSEEEFRPISGENRFDAYQRAKQFYDLLKKEKPLSKILVVSHAGFISDMVTLLLGLKEKENVHFKTGFCSITRFLLDDEFRVKEFSIGHLEHLAKSCK
jgi:broad specificity phosphatase PhoE